MKKVRLIAIGRLRTPHWQSAAEEYHRRLIRLYDFKETILKDAASSLPPAERNRVEGERILTALDPKESPILLDEHGEALDSRGFSIRLDNLFGKGRTPCFILGGAHGFSPEVREKIANSLSFGPMTFPHELARVILLEQLFRADSIARGTPYHHV